jgi:hypothetical protein
MGTTLTALQGDGLRVCFVIAIEGFEYLLTDLETPANLFTSSTGWHGTDWSQALGGLSMEGVVFEQSITPWDSKIVGNEVSFSVMDYDGADVFGEAVFKTGAGNENPLQATLTNTQTTSVKVKDTTNFASSGSCYIGTEHITYTSKDSDELKTLTRGRYSPFKTDSGAGFGRYHKINTKMGTVPAPVIVSDKPRVWIGKFCGIWMHRVTGNTADTKANAELLHAGKITGIQDSSSGNTTITVSGILDTIRDSTIGFDQFVGRVKKGIYIDTDFRLKYRSIFIKTSVADPPVTTYHGSTWQYFNPTTSDLALGEWYTVDEFKNIFNKWLDAHVVAGNFLAGVSVGLTTEWGGVKFVVNQEEYASGWQYHQHGFQGPRKYLQMLGWDVPGLGMNDWVEVGPNDGWENPPDNLVPDNEPIAVRGFQGCGPDGTLELEFSDGDWTDNTAELPSFIKSRTNITGTGWGILKIKDNYAIAKRVSDTSFNPVMSVPELSKTLGLPFSQLSLGTDNGMGDIRYSEGSELEIKQVIMLEGTFQTLMSKMLATTGTDAFNEANYDKGTTWGPHMGCAIPYSLLDTAFESSVAGLDLAGNTMLMILDKPTPFGELFLSDVTLRGAYFIFRNGTVRLTAPQTAVSSLSTHTLTEDNKASPSGQADLNRTPTIITNEFLRNVFKLKYKRDIKSGEYLEEKTYMFQSSIDDFGEAKAITVSARNSFKGPDYIDSANQLGINIVARLLPAWGKPMQRLRRTVDMSLYLDVAPGDICLVTDSFARDPATGTRGITNKPALIISHSFAVTGGLMGEVDLLIGALDNVTAYAPSAKIDADIANSGYTAGTPSITCEQNDYTSVYDTRDDAEHFEAGDLIRIEEISPSNPASTTYWDRTVASVSGNVITLTSTLSSPAWDTAKEYNVFSQTYASAQATQKIDCYQADDADNRIVNTENPRNYGSFNETLAMTAPPATVLPQKHSNSWFGDGAPLSVVCHKNLAKMVNNLIGYKTAPKGAFFHSTGTALTGLVSSASWKTFKTYPVYIGVGADSANGARTVTISPVMKASGASSCKCRVTISKIPPTVDPTAATPALNLDTEFQLPFAQAEFTTSSTSYATIAAQTLPCIINTATGLAWVTIELKGSGSHSTVFWGLGRFEVGAPGI